MPPTGPGTLLHTVEIVHWAALAVMGVVYATRIGWLFRFRGTRDRQAPGNLARTTPMKGALHSLANVAMPWTMESTRKGFPFYLSFVVFHLGVVAGIGLAFLSTVARGFVSAPIVAAVSGVLLSAAFLVALYRLVRRIVRPVMRLISTPDDYFSLAMLTVWFAVGIAAQAGLAGLLPGEGFLVAYLLLTSFFLLYVPFSKISHYLYYPFTRFWIGRTLGHRGALPAIRG